MTDTSPRLDLPYLQPSQAQKHVTHNEALSRLDAVTQMAVAGVGAETPPTAPEAGEIHALGPVPTGAWAGQAGRMALWDGVAWQFFPPRPGWRAWDLAAGMLRVFDGAGWVSLAADYDNLDGVGIGTAADAVNRLAVVSEAVLFSHAGAGHQVKVNKAAPGDTASLLFQSGWSGRAEMGLAGDDDFRIKVSADGGAWADAASFSGATGAAAFLSGLTVGGKAAYHRGNAVGLVSHGGGQPTGALIETGGNANGAWIRFADGSQVAFRIAVVDVSATTLQNFAFPAAFVGDVAAWCGHRSTAPHAALALGNLRVIAGVAGASQQWSLRLTSAGVPAAPGTVTEQLALAALGRWF